jgi:hypothetical protein
MRYGSAGREVIVLSRHFRQRTDWGLQRGRNTEYKVFGALESVTRKPKWLFKVRRATEEEDCNGFDGFVELDVGTVPIQIKTSQDKVRIWRKKHPNVTNVVFIVVPAAVTEYDEILSRAYAKLWAWRVQVLRRQMGLEAV